MDNYRRLKKDGTPYGRYSTKASDKPVEGHYRYVQDTPTFESTVTKGGQGTRGDKTFTIGAKEYDRPKKKEEKTRPSKTKPKKADKPVYTFDDNKKGALTQADKEIIRKIRDEEMLRKMGERYDEIMPNPEYAKGGSVMTPKMQKKVGTVMKEYKAGSLHSGKGGKVVKNPKQAVAIAMSEARRIKK